MASKVVSGKGVILGPFLDLAFMNFQAPGGEGAEGFKCHLKSCSLLLVSGVLLARARGSKIDPTLVQNRGQKPPRSRPDGFESCLQYGCDFSANFESFFEHMSYFQVV